MLPVVRRVVRVVSLGLPAAMAGCNARTDSFDTVTRQGDSITTLFVITLVIGTLVFLLVAGVLVHAIVRYRERPGADEPRQVEGVQRLELIWTATPLLLLSVLFVVTVRTMWSVDDPPARDEGLTVVVVGHQWWWEYRYPGARVSTANELHLPTGTPIRLELQSNDVVHSFWVPRFGWKLDAVPGRTNVMTIRIDAPGTYDGACAEFCGAQHAWMRIHVVAESRAQFDAWLQAQAQPATPPADDLARRGQELFLANTCANCHRIAGTAADGTVGPDLTHLAGRQTLGAGVRPNTADDLRAWIQDARSIKPGARMPAYSFTDEELDALVRYLEGLR